MVLSVFLIRSCVLCVLDRSCWSKQRGWTGTDWSRHTVSHVVNTQGTAGAVQLISLRSKS